jgi:hypothetical protein
VRIGGDGFVERVGGSVIECNVDGHGAVDELV